MARRGGGQRARSSTKSGRNSVKNCAFKRRHAKRAVKLTKRKCAGLYEAGITLASDTALADTLRLAVHTGDLALPVSEDPAQPAAALGEIRLRALASALWAQRNPEWADRPTT